MKQIDMFGDDELRLTQILTKMRADKNYHGFCTTIVDNKGFTEKSIKYLDQYDKHGFDDTELFDLDASIACYILPRLKAFKERNFYGVDKGEAIEGDDVFQPHHVDKMITCFEQVADHNYDMSDQEDIKEGLALFTKFFRALYL